ncbi:hypothetical protein Aperf_G00000006972 [Anoplocephala perfoliata]
MVFFPLCSFIIGSDILKLITDTVIEEPWIFITTHLSVSVSIFLCLPLLFDVVGSYIDMLLMGSNLEAIPLSRRSSLHHLWYIGTRGGALSICILIGTLLSHFAQVMAIIEAVSSSFVCFIIPPIFLFFVLQERTEHF